MWIHIEIKEEIYSLPSNSLDSTWYQSLRLINLGIEKEFSSAFIVEFKV